MHLVGGRRVLRIAASPIRVRRHLKPRLPRLAQPKRTVHKCGCCQRRVVIVGLVIAERACACATHPSTCMVCARCPDCCKCKKTLIIDATGKPLVQ